MKILVTGGCGFIGSNFIRYIAAKYPTYKITNLDKLTYAGNLENLKDIAHLKNYNFIKGDICDENVVDKLAKVNDVVINFAAESHVDRSIKNSRDFLRTNVHGVDVILGAVRNNKIKRYIQISTDEVYGSILFGSAKEEDALKPNSPYAASKASADLLCRAYFKTFNLPVIITRSSNNFGPYQYPEKVIPLFITNLLENKKVPLYGDGLNERDWLFVLDNVRAIDLVLHKGKIGQIYNIGIGKEIANLKLTKILLDSLGKTKKMVKYVVDRLGHDRRYSIDNKKIVKLGWQPNYDFQTAISLTIRWYKENKSWWKKFKKS
ncbi:MAG: dTDP-glucose 4,6-dehydratase [Patescibacteria group bacterium]